MQGLRVLSFAVGVIGMVSSPLVFGQSDWVLPAIDEGQEARENCLGLIAVLPVMKSPQMQALIASPEIYKAGGNALMVKAVAARAKAEEADALFTLGMLFESGSCFGGKKDLKLAHALYLQAAERGSPEAKKRAPR